MSKGTVLYVGGFILPDKNAAAQRVLAIAKILRDINYDVIFLNKTPFSNAETWTETSYYGFQCYEKRKEGGKAELVHELVDIDYIKEYVQKINDVIAVIAYNFPAIALKKLNHYCKRKKIKCIGDVTEWYGSRGRSLVYKIIKGLDTSYRMRVVQKQLSGNIVISDFLEEYYSRYTNVVNLPPLVDKTEEKWDCECQPHKGVHLIYAGSPSSEKERLDLIVDAVTKVRKLHDVSLTVVGITQEQFVKLYHNSKIDFMNANYVQFLGRMSHKDVIRYVSSADFSVLIRDNNRVNTAGFPTKFVESISCNTAVIANSSSCIAKYLSDGENGFLIAETKLEEELNNILELNKYPIVKEDLFDYRNFIEPMQKFMES